MYTIVYCLGMVLNSPSTEACNGQYFSKSFASVFIINKSIYFFIWLFDTLCPNNYLISVDLLPLPLPKRPCFTGSLLGLVRHYSLLYWLCCDLSCKDFDYSTIFVYNKKYSQVHHSVSSLTLNAHSHKHYS